MRWLSNIKHCTDIQKFSNATQEQCDAIVIVTTTADYAHLRTSLIRISACACGFQTMKMWIARKPWVSARMENR